LREKKGTGDGIWSSYVQAVPLVKGRLRNCSFWDPFRLGWSRYLGGTGDSSQRWYGELGTVELVEPGSAVGR
jgi:hypothetical protein